MLKKSLYLAFVCSLLFCCVCCSASGPDDSQDAEVFSLAGLSYSVPSSWSSYPDSDDSEELLSHSSHTSPDGSLDLVVDRFRLDYEGPWSPAADDPELASEYLAPADYDAGGMTIPGFWYKSDDGAMVYLYELTDDAAYYRFTFTLRGDSDEPLPSVHAILDSVRLE